MPMEAVIFPLAGLFYTVATGFRSTRTQLQSWTLATFGIGLALDTFGTVYVCVIRTGGYFMPTSIHGVAGYVAWAIMAMHFAWALKSRISRHPQSTKSFHSFSDMAWGLWSTAFLTGFPGLTGEALTFVIIGSWFVYAALRVIVVAAPSLPTQA